MNKDNKLNSNNNNNNNNNNNEMNNIHIILYNKLFQLILTITTLGFVTVYNIQVSFFRHTNTHTDRQTCKHSYRHTQLSFEWIN